MVVRIRGSNAKSQVIESADSMAALLKSVAHPSRIQILGVGMRGDASVVELMQATRLSKTALSNHLSQLIGNGLIQRVSRGEYRTTADGRGLLSAASNAYKNSVRRSVEQKEVLMRTYSSALAGETDVERSELKKISYQRCWLSYLGAMAGCLRYLGVKCGTADVGGYSGYSFLINVSKGETCPSGPTALHMKTFKRMVRGTESLGWKLDVYTYPRSYPAKEGRPTAQEMELVRAIFERIKKEIRENRKPVVLWGLAAPEYGIVRGYLGDSYLVETFRGAAEPRQSEDPIPYHDLKAAGCIDAFFFTQRLRISSSVARRDALERALAFAEGDVDVQSNYVAGPAALDEWADVLESLNDAGQNYMGNSYVGACVQEGRRQSGLFLKGLSKKVPVKQARHLARASESYERGSRLMLSFTRTFPFQFRGEMPLQKRKQGARILRKARSEEEHAIQQLRKVC
jgi:DNA-binding HxlR family transcriptional regulator